MLCQFRVYILIYSFSYSFPLWFVTGYGIQFPVLYSRTLLFIHSIYNSLHLLTPNSQSIPFNPSPLATTSLFFFFNFYLFYLFLAALGLRCCTQAFSSCSKRGYSLLRCAGLSLQWLLLLQSMGSRCAGFSSCGSRALEHRLSSCGAWAQLLCIMWDLPGPGIEPVSPVLAGRFLTTVPPGKSHKSLLYVCKSRYVHLCHVVDSTYK